MANSSTNLTLIVRVAIPVPLNRLFDYLIPEQLTCIAPQPGTRVSVPFGKSNKVGFIIETVKTSDIEINRLKQINEILDESPLICKKDIQLLQWASNYYHHPLGDVFSAAFPVSLRKGKKATLSQEKYYTLSKKGQLLISDQLKRTPKQKQLFEHFQSQSKSLSATELNEWNKNWHSALKSLLDKELLSIELKTKLPAKKVITPELPLAPNEQQSQAINTLTAKLGNFSVSLLEGVTGSGKTEVYMQVTQKVLDLGQQVIVLLPEITLTPQLEDRFKKRFSVSLSVSHSKLTETQRHSAWLEMQQGHSSILLGTRSALFTPLKKIGLIILDEEHDTSFKQQEGFRFSARDLAIVRAKLFNIPVILGTATPSLESLHNSEKKRYELLHLSERAGKAIKPKFLLFDIRNKKLQDGLSDPLITHIKNTLTKKEQVLLFLNRRGYAPVQICHTCAWVARCQHCDTSMVIHYAEETLRCHHCGFQQRLLTHCPSCKIGELKPLGLGTERVEQSLHALFPTQKIIRLDRDTTQRKGSLERHLEQINQGEVDIILGTQMLAKGHHFPNVTLVAILDVDSGLFSIDFHAIEKLAQLIIQVAGRAGRAEKPGTVILQTRQPDHPLLTVLLKEGYNKFARTALAERQQASLPPFSFQALLRVYASNPADPQLFLNKVCTIIQQINHNKTLVLGPVSAPMAKRAGYYHFQLLLQNTNRKRLQALLDQLIPQLYIVKEGKKVRWSIDVDPVDLY
ncbi:MAG: primosomal protein N' [Methylococcales bacterium]|nr:primosomal protein N' [Methylococcales bacterium]